MSGTDKTMLDMDTINTLREVLGDELADIVDDFNSSAVDYIKQLEQSISTQNHEDSMNIAHTLKGMAGNIGAIRLSQLCQVLESEAKAMKVNDGPSQLSRIANALKKTQEELASLF